MSPSVVFLVAAPVAAYMSREFTFFQFDVDEETLRSVLSSIPGVTPLPADGRDGPETERPAGEDGTAQPVDGAGVASSTTAGTGPTDEPATGEPSAGSPGVEAHLEDSTGESRPTATTWTRPSTPWPGAPTDEADGEDEGLLARLREKKLLIGGVVAALGVVSAAAVWFLKFRDGDGGGDVAGSGSRAGRRDENPEEPHADDADSREYPVDAAPVIGMAFLAVATVLLRRFGGGRGD